MRQRLHLRPIVTTAAACAIAGLSAGSANAATRDVIIDSTANQITLATGTAGTHTARVTLTNLSDVSVPVTAKNPADATCSVTPDEKTLDPGTRTEFKLTLEAGCEVEGGVNVVLEFGAGVNPASYSLTLDPPANETPDWDILLRAFLLAFGVSVMILVLVAGQLVDYNWSHAPAERLGFRTELAHLGTGWSFKDNWVGSVTIGSAALVALLASSDVLTAVLGTKPEAALGLLVVAAALAALFVAIGPLVVKLFGKSTSTPTVGGTLLAAVVTLVGTLGQVIATSWQVSDLTSGATRVGLWVTGSFVGVVVFLYAVRALWEYIEIGTKPEGPKPPSDVAAAADRIDRAIRKLPPAATPQPLDPYEGAPPGTTPPPGASRAHVNSLL